MDRIDAEYAHLKLEYGTALLSPAREWVEVPDYPLPAGLFAPAAVRVRMPLSRAYPEVAPDNFYTSPGLKLAGGQPLNNYPDTPRWGETWGQFSWHPKRWFSKANLREGDNMRTFFNSIRQRLEEGR